MGKLARMPWLLLVLLFGAGFVMGLTPDRGAARQDSAQAAPIVPDPQHKEVLLGCNLSDEQTIVFTSTVAASGHPGVVLLDSPRQSKYLRAFLSDFRPDRVIPIGSFEESAALLNKRLGTAVEVPAEWKEGPPTRLWKRLFPRAERVVVVPHRPRKLLLRAACLAGVLKAPLYVTRDDSRGDTELRRWLKDWQAQEVYAVGPRVGPLGVPAGVRIIRLADEASVAASCLRHQAKQGPIETLVVANPADTRRDLGRMSLLGPMLATRKRAALLLTGDEGDDAAALVRQALKEPALRQAESMLLLADLRAVPMERRPNPAEGKDTHIEMEPCTPTGSEPFTLATGRLFNEDPAVVLLVQARHRLLATRTSPRKALVVSNPGGGLPLLEMFSRNTARELHNCGYETQTLFGRDVTKADVRRLLPSQDVFLWEGHHSTLIRDYEFPTWTEPMPPSLVFLQSCLALAEAKAQPLLERGAVAVVGSSTRTYSASGGACSLAFFDALLYDQQSLGGSLRQAKNFLVACTLLKEKRLGKEARLNGANLRAAWAFTLWGDPTLKLPVCDAPGDRLEPIRHTVQGNTITLTLPPTHFDRVTTPKYQALARPNARLAGLLTPADGERKQLVPFVFAEVHLPRAPADRTPRLHGRLSSQHWVFSWDPRRRCGYLLVTPRSRDQTELKFHVDWHHSDMTEDRSARPVTAAMAGGD